MSTYKPIVLYNGVKKRIQTGDTVLASNFQAHVGMSTTKYVKLSNNIYILYGIPNVWTTASINKLATYLTGGTATRCGKGSIMLAASFNRPASALYIKIQPATWAKYTGAAI